MPREVDATGWSSPCRSDGIPERVSAGRTPVVPRGWRYPLAAILIVAATIAWFEPLEPDPATPELLTLAGHTRLVEAVTFSPDGRTLASCGWDGTVRLWDLARRVEGDVVEAMILSHDSVRFAMAFSPDGSLLAESGHGSVTIWSCRPGYRRERERAVGEIYRSLSFSPDGRTLALAADDSTIRLWDMPSARERMVLRGHTDAVWSVAFSPDGKRLISASPDGRVMLWDATRGIALRSLVSRGAVPMRSVAFSPDGRTVGLGEPTRMTRDVMLWDVETGAIRTRLTGHPSGVHAVAFSPDGRTLAAVGIDGRIEVRDLTAASEGGPTALVDDARWVKSVAFSPDGGWMAYAGSDETIRLLDLRSPLPPSSGPPAVGSVGKRSTS
jgi:WD40 repeat protein